MKYIIEFDGPLADIGPVYYRTYRDVAARVGWSRMDQATYWRLVRKQGSQANVLPGARPAKMKEFQTLFDERVEQDDAVGRCELHPWAEEALAVLTRHGTCCLVTLGSNLDARRRLLERAGLSDCFERAETLDADPRRRPAGLSFLAHSERRTVVVASTDSIVRATGQAGLFAAGVTSGSCSASRLHQGGVDVVYPNLSAVAESIRTGAEDMIRAGLLPPPLD